MYWHPHIKGSVNMIFLRSLAVKVDEILISNHMSTAKKLTRTTVNASMDVFLIVYGLLNVLVIIDD
jgi:hypothetical protein